MTQGDTMYLAIPSVDRVPQRQLNEACNQRDKNLRSYSRAEVMKTFAY